MFWSELVTLWQEEPRSTRSYQVSDRVNAASARPAALARHYRDRASLTIAEIVRRLGRAEDAAKAYLYDPTGEKARAVKRRYEGVCRGCGAPTTARNGYVARHISPFKFTPPCKRPTNAGDLSR